MTRSSSTARRAPARPVRASDKVHADPRNPGFFNVDGVPGYFSREVADRVARQVTPEDDSGVGEHQDEDVEVEDESA